MNDKIESSSPPFEPKKKNFNKKKFKKKAKIQNKPGESFFVLLARLSSWLFLTHHLSLEAIFFVDCSFLGNLDKDI